MLTPSAPWVRCLHALATGGAVLATLAAGSPPALAAAPSSSSPIKTPDPQELVVKLRDDTTATADGRQLRLASSAAQERLNALLGPERTTVVEPLFDRSPRALDADRSRLLFQGQKTPDLTAWFRVRLAPGQTQKTVLAELRRDPLVEHADPGVSTAPPPAAEPPYTLNGGADLRAWQRPLIGSGPGGMGFGAVAGLPGGTGDRVKLVVNEGKIGPHEDLPTLPAAKTYGDPYDPAANWRISDHATATFGVMMARTDNLLGVNGLAPGADTRLAFWQDGKTDQQWLNTLDEAIQDMSTGDVLLLEAQDGTNIGEGLTPGRLATFGPKSIVPAFADVLRTAVARGVIVILPAGNGLVCEAAPAGTYPWSTCTEVDPADTGYDLDKARFVENGQLKPIPDIGAIVVGAGVSARGTSETSETPCVTSNGWGDSPAGPARSRTDFASWGQRTIQVQGPGNCVFTTGTPDPVWAPLRQYHDNFNGTSSASAVVAAAAAVLSSAYEARTGRALTPENARKSLIAGGSPQTAGIQRPTGSIGPLPHVGRALDYLTTAPETIVTRAPARNSHTNNPQQTFEFTSNWTSGVEFECSVGAPTAPWQPCTSPWTPPAQPEGTIVYRIRATSPGGVDGTPDARAVFFDTTPPDTVIGGGPEHRATVTASSVTYSFSATGETMPAFECRLNTQAWQPCTSPHTIRGLPPGPNAFNVRARDRAGNVDPSPAVRIFTVPTGRALSIGTATAPAATVNLTGSPTAAEWVHWRGNGLALPADRANVLAPRLSGLEKYGSGPVNLVTGSSLFSWTNAAGTPVGSSRVGVGTGGSNGRGYRFTVVPTTVDTRTLRVWVGAAGAGSRGQLRASFPGQAAVVSQEVQATGSAYVDRVYELTYRPGSATDTLSVEWVQTAGASAGRVVLYAAQVE